MERQAPHPELVIQEYSPLIDALCRRMISDRELARDAAQEVWIQVIRSLPGFRGESKLSTWIHTVARRTILAWAARERQLSFAGFVEPFRTEAPYQPPSREPVRLEAWIRATCNDCLTAILRCLESDARLIYLLRQVAFLPYAEIARAMEKDEVAIRQSVSRSSRKLARFGKAECALFNPAGTCRCRMKPWVENSAMVGEFKQLRQALRRLGIIQAAERVFDCAPAPRHPHDRQ
jgi:RNA polymerase sigma-70 factor (ECF subfamily)